MKNVFQKSVLTILFEEKIFYQSLKTLFSTCCAAPITSTIYVVFSTVAWNVCVGLVSFLARSILTSFLFVQFLLGTNKYLHDS